MGVRGAGRGTGIHFDSSTTCSPGPGLSPRPFGSPCSARRLAPGCGPVIMNAEPASQIYTLCPRSSTANGRL